MEFWKGVGYQPVCHSEGQCSSQSCKHKEVYLDEVTASAYAAAASKHRFVEPTQQLGFYDSHFPYCHHAGGGFLQSVQKTFAESSGPTKFLKPKTEGKVTSLPPGIGRVDEILSRLEYLSSKIGLGFYDLMKSIREDVLMEKQAKFELMLEEEMGVTPTMHDSNPVMAIDHDEQFSQLPLGYDYPYDYSKIPMYEKSINDDEEDDELSMSMTPPPNAPRVSPMSPFPKSPKPPVSMIPRPQTYVIPNPSQPLHKYYAKKSVGERPHSRRAIPPQKNDDSDLEWEESDIEVCPLTSTETTPRRRPVSYDDDVNLEDSDSVCILSSSSPLNSSRQSSTDAATVEPVMSTTSSQSLPIVNVDRSDTRKMYEYYSRALKTTRKH